MATANDLSCRCFFCTLAQKPEAQGLDRLTRLSKRLQPGDQLFEEGSSGCVWSIGSGAAKVIKSGYNGKTTLLRIIQTGDMVGLCGTLSDHGHNATVLAMKSTTVCGYRKEEFREALVASAPLAFAVAQILEHELTKTQLRLSETINLTVQQRLAKLIVELCRSHGIKTPKSIVIDLPITRTDLADLVGAAPETVMRALSDFQNRGWMESGRGLKINKLPRIEAAADASLG